MPPTTQDIFSTVPKQDYLSLFQNGEPKCQDIVNFIHLKKEDVAKATDVPISSVRWDEKMPAELRERVREWATLFNLVAEHFRGDAGKTALWFTMTNPMLGDIAPRDMIRFGRYKKLLKFILNSIDENKA